MIFFKRSLAGAEMKSRVRAAGGLKAGTGPHIVHYAADPEILREARCHGVARLFDTEAQRTVSVVAPFDVVAGFVPAIDTGRDERRVENF